MGTIANKINKVKNTKDKIKTITNLSTLNAITSETVFKDYPKQILKEYIKIINNGTNELYTNFPKVEDEGIKLELNTEKGPLRMILEGNTSQITNILPEEYTQVDYIESSGTQYIDTGFKPNQDTKVDIKLYSLSTNIYFNVPFGARVGDTEQFFIGLQTNSNQHWFLRYGTLTNLSKYGVKYGYNHIVFNKNEVYFNNELAYSFNQQTFQNPYNMYLFACNVDGTVDRNFYGYIYGCQIYDNDVLIRNFIPCIRNSDNEVGMYDLVTNTFYTNQGTGIFTYNSVVQIPNPDYPQDIKVATGEQNVEILNNNYFNINEIIENSYITNRGATGSSSVSNVSNYIEVRGEEQIIIEYDYDILLSTSDRSIVFYDENKNYISGQYFEITKKSILITPAQSGFIRFGYDKNCENIRVFNEKQIYPLSLDNIELARINNYKDYIFKNVTNSPYYNADLELNEWYYSNLFTKINSYNGETITTPYISTTGGLDIGATIYYYNNSNVPIKITDTTLISQLENINNNARSYSNTTIIECSSLTDDNETIQVSAIGLKNID